MLVGQQVNVAKMHKADKIKVLKEKWDFKFQKIEVKELNIGNRVISLSKHVWCFTKQYASVSVHCDYTFQGLETTINESKL